MPKKILLKLSILTIVLISFNINAIAQETFEDYMTQGVKFMEKAQYKDAIANFDKATKKKPDNPYTYYLKGQIYLLQNKWDKAITELNITVEKRDTIPNTYYYLGYSYFHKKDTVQALLYTDKCLSLNPWHRDALIFRLSSYTDKKMFDKAKPYIDRAKKKYPKDTEIMYYQALYLLSKKENVKALNILEESYSLGYRNDEFLNILGTAYLKNDMLSKALIRTNEAIAIDPNKSDYYINKALILYEMKINSMALNSFEKAIELGAILSEGAENIYDSLKK